MMTVNFKSCDQKLDCYSIICKNTDIFSNLERILYKNNKEYYDSENYFTVNGIKVTNHKTLKENNIKNNDIIILNLLEI